MYCDNKWGGFRNFEHGNSRPVQLYCIAYIPVQRAFLHPGGKQFGARAKTLNKAGVSGASKGLTVAHKPFDFKKPLAQNWAPYWCGMVLLIEG